MQTTLVFNCLLCLLVVHCTAAPGADTDLSSGSANVERVDKLKAGDTDQLSDSADDGRIVRLQGSDKNADTGALDDVLPGSVSANEGPINAEDNNDNLVTHEEIGDENTDNEEKNATSEPIDGENTGNEEQGNGDYIPAPNSNEDQKGAFDDSPNNALPSESNSVDNKNMEQDGNSETSPSPSETKEEAVQSIIKDCKSGTNGCKYDLDKLSIIPGFQLSAAEMTKFKIWPEAKIPYYIDELSYDKVLRDKIRSYLDEARSQTGLHFEELMEPPVGDDERWVFFVNRRGQLDCKDYNTNSFTNTGVQKVIIGYNCLEHGGPMAAIVLALAGVPPQHNSPDRDRYIKVVTDHILPEKKGSFKPLKDSDWLFHDLGYDFDSASHYPSHQYTADGSETIQVLVRGRPIKDSWKYVEEKKTYSGMDLLKVRYLYNNVLLNKLIYYGIKPEDCKALYRPGPNYKNLKLKERKSVPVRPKPKKYLAAARNEKGPEKLVGLGNGDIEAAQLSSLEA